MAWPASMTKLGTSSSSTQRPDNNLSPCWGRAALYGLGYSPGTREYKVARFFYPDHNPNRIATCEVGERCWRRVCCVDAVPYAEHMTLGRSLYWLMRGMRICSFDLKTETLRLHELPTSEEINPHFMIDLVDIDGSLCLVCYAKQYPHGWSCGCWVTLREEVLGFASTVFQSNQVLIRSMVEASSKARRSVQRRGGIISDSSCFCRELSKTLSNTNFFEVLLE